MSTPIQDIKTIGKAEQVDPQEDTRSQPQKDYEEGRGYVERGEPALAAVSLHNALQGFEEEGNKEGVANASNQLGHACLQRKEYEKAWKTISEPGISARRRMTWQVCSPWRSVKLMRTPA